MECNVDLQINNSTCLSNYDMVQARHILCHNPIRLIKQYLQQHNNIHCNHSSNQHDLQTLTYYHPNNNLSYQSTIKYIMELRQLERQRINLYKKHLIQQIQSKQQQHSNQSVNNATINIFQPSNNHHHIKLTPLHNQYQSNHLNISNQSFTDQMYQSDILRHNQLKTIRYNQQRQNQQKSQSNKVYQNHIKSIQLTQQHNHNQTLSHQHQKSISNYNSTKQKYSQNMHLYQLQRTIQQQNDALKHNRTKLFENQPQIFDKIKRDNFSQHKKLYKQYQQQIKKQIDETANRRKKQKIQYNSPENIQKSMLNTIFTKNQKNNNLYSHQLKNQINQKLSKQAQQIKQSKQKYQINNIYGGKIGRQRYQQIQYVDRQLGLTSDLNHSLYEKSIKSSSNKQNIKKHQKINQQSINQIQQKSQINETMKTQSNMFMSNSQQNSKRNFLSFDPIAAANRYFEYNK